MREKIITMANEICALPALRKKNGTTIFRTTFVDIISYKLNCPEQEISGNILREVARLNNGVYINEQGRARIEFN